jgi:hypothetical protein
MENNSRNISYNIISLFIGVSGILLAIYSLNKDHTTISTGDKIIIVLLVAFLIVSIFVGIWEYQKFSQSRIILLKNKNEIFKAIKKYSENSKYENAMFIGELHKDIISDLLANLSSSHFKSVNIISGDFHSYSNELENDKTEISDWVKQLYRLEATMDDSIFSSRFLIDYQVCNIFVAKNNSEKRTIIFLKNDLNDYSGLLIRDKRFSISVETIVSKSFSMNIESKQHSSISETLSQMEILWLPCREGYFNSVLPPLKDQNVRMAWREKILADFNIYASEIVTADEYSEMYITWNLTELSKEDIATFSDWLNILFERTNSTSFTVHRYLLIDMVLYKKDENYKSTVAEINSFLSSHRNGNYKFYYIDSSSLQSICKNDYAWFRGKEKTHLDIIQSAIIDSQYEPKLLKIYFSKSFQEVNSVKEKFKFLKSLKLATSLDELKSIYSIK